MALFNFDKFFAVAAALGDAATSVTATMLGAVQYLWTGSAYVRSPGDATNGAKVQLASSAVSLATSTKQSDGSQKTQVVDASGNVQPAGDTAARPVFGRLTDGTTAYVGAKTGQLPSALGTQTMSGAVPVTIATDDTLMAAIKADVDKIPSKGTATMTGAAPVTIATDDTLMAAIKADVDKIPSKGTATMTGAAPVTIATDDTLMAAIKADVDKIPSKGTATMTGAAPVTIATDDTLMAAIKADVDKIPSKGTATMTGATPVTLATDDAAVKGITPVTSNGTPAQITAGSATQFASQAVSAGIWVENDGGSSANIRVGDSNVTTTRGVQLAPGRGRFFSCQNANQYYHIAESGSPKINLLYQ